MKLKSIFILQGNFQEIDDKFMGYKCFLRFCAAINSEYILRIGYIDRLRASFNG